jgi:uncharacterized membrane protein
MLDIKAIVLILLSGIILGFSPHCEKKGIESCMDEMLFLGVRSLFMFLLFILYVFITREFKCINHFNKQSCIDCFIAAIILFIGLFLSFKALSYGNVSQVSPLLFPMIMIFSVLYGYLFFKEKLSKNKIFGLLVITIGMLIVVYND